MIIKSFEIENNLKVVKEKNIFLFYGENIGLKKYLKELILIEKKKTSNKINILYYVEDEILKQT